MKAFLAALGSALVAYPVGGVLGALLVHLASANTHDRSVEAAMTGAFVTGPLAAVVAFVVVLVVALRRRRAGRPRLLT